MVVVVVVIVVVVVLVVVVVVVWWWWCDGGSDSGGGGGGVLVVVWWWRRWWWRWQHFTWEISVPTFSLASLLTENFSLNLFSLIWLVHIATGTQVGILEY
jgi:hypothetical protein